MSMMTPSIILHRDIDIENDLVLLYNNLHLPSKNWKEYEIMQICKNHPMYLEWSLQIMAETRDLEEGKGERSSTYQLLEQWLQINPLAALDRFEVIIRSYGSWKDIKYLCQHLYNKSPQHEAIPYLLQMLNNALLSCHETTMVGKWVPREKSKLGHFYHYLAMDWNTRILRQPPDMALSRIYKQYRQSLALVKSRKNPNIISNAQQITFEDLVGKALELSTTGSTQVEQTCIEKEWGNCRKEIWNQMVVILDADVEHVDESRYYKIACRLIKNNRVPRCWVISNHQPVWISMEGKTVVEMVDILKKYREKASRAEAKTSGVLEAVQIMVSKMMKCNMKSDDIEKMTWVVITDMSKNTYLHSWIIQMFYAQGHILIPHMIYIHYSNQEIQKGIPWVETARCTIFPATRKGLTSLQWKQIQTIQEDANVRQFTPWQSIVAIINHPRYRQADV